MQTNRVHWIATNAIRFNSHTELVSEGQWHGRDPCKPRLYTLIIIAEVNGMGETSVNLVYILIEVNGMGKPL